MKNLYLFLVLIPFFSSSQNFQWVNFPSVVNDQFSSQGNVTTCDNLGNVYLVGIKDNQVVSGNYYGHLFYRKYNSSGTLLFEKIIGGKARILNMISDLAGNIYLAAAFKNSINFESGATINTSETSDVLVVIKLDLNGTFLWNKNFTNVNGNCGFKAITTDSNNNVYIGLDNLDGNIEIDKLSSLDGSTLMTIIQENIRIISSLSVDSVGNIYAAGSCGDTNNATFAGVVQPSNLPYNTYATKYSSSGVHQWTKYVEDNTCTDPVVSVKNPNAVYFSSGLGGAFAFGSLTALGFSEGFSDDIFVTK